MNLALTSDLPSTVNQVVFDLMKKDNAQPRIAWIAPSTNAGHEYFPTAQNQFSTYGFSNLEYCDIDEKSTETQLAAIDQYDVIYLAGGDPIQFRQNILRSGFSTQLQNALDAGRLVVAASGGSMQLTKNVSLYRLLTTAIDKVLVGYHKYEALGIVKFEIVPHVNRLESSFLEKVRLYSERVTNDVFGLSDGAALVFANSDDYLCTGQVIRFRKGEVKIMEMTHR